MVWCEVWCVQCADCGVVWCGVQVYLEHVVDALEAVDSLEGLLCGGGQGKGTAAEGVGLTRAAVDFNHLHFLVSHTGDHTLVRGLTPVRGREEGGKRGERGRRGKGEGGKRGEGGREEGGEREEGGGGGRERGVGKCLVHSEAVDCWYML